MTNTETAVVGGIEFRRFSSLYAVSACGLALSLRTLTVAPPRKAPNGYLAVGRGYHRGAPAGGGLMHRMVAACWLPRPDGAKHVHHINGDKADNRAANLEWVTPRQHMAEKHDFSGRYTRSEETRQRLREYRLGRKASDETKQKQREAITNQWRLGLRTARAAGWKATAEHRANLSLGHARKVQCEVRGVVYASFTEAGRALGERPLSLRKRCLSPNFPDYRIVEG